MSLQYLNWLKKDKQLYTKDNKVVDVYTLKYDISNTAIISEWAKHFRQNYCEDSKIDRFRGNNYSRKEYLQKLKFPSPSNAPGPSTRAGDFSEILIADFLEFLGNYYVPRLRYNHKDNPDMSTPGIDVVAFKQLQNNKKSPDDELQIFEVKARFTNSSTSEISRLQDAIDDSDKDIEKIAKTLAAMKEKLIWEGKDVESNIVDRFQDTVENPYKTKYGAAAVYSTSVFDEKTIQDSYVYEHRENKSLQLIVISGENLKKLANKLYEVAADEA